MKDEMNDVYATWEAHSRGSSHEIHQRSIFIGAPVSANPFGQSCVWLRLLYSKHSCMDCGWFDEATVFTSSTYRHYQTDNLSLRTLITLFT